MLTIKKFVVNPIQENTYLLFDETGECVIVDPGFHFDEEKDEVDYFIEKNELNPVRLINTHCHFDHLMGVEYIRKKYELEFEAHNLENYLVSHAVEQASMFGIKMEPVSPIDKFLVENEIIQFGENKLKVIHVPGHSPGHVAFYDEEGGKLFCGDVLFYGSIGRTDLAGGDQQTLVSSIKSKLLGLPGDTTVYCGHGPETTIGFEMAYNPFLT